MKVTKSDKASMDNWATCLLGWRKAYASDHSEENTKQLIYHTKCAKQVYANATGTYLTEDEELDATDTSKMFVDADFPPAKWNINFKGKVMLAAKRPCQLQRNAVFSPNDEFNLFDIDQGQLGDCYFISALAALTCKKGLVAKMVTFKDEKLGKYTFKFFKNGRPVFVTVDDLLPVDSSGTPSGARSNIENHFWVPILEKAYAKLHGGYEQIGQGGQPCDSILEMIGGTEYSPPCKSANAVFKTLTTNFDNTVLCCFSDLPPKMKAEETNDKGVVKMHAYSIMQATEIKIPEDNKTYRLIKIRNPWGNAAWKGEFCDKHKSWTPGLKSALKVEPWLQAEEGIFWMTPEDFVQEFCYLSGVKI
jgi:hypothetical protein